MYLLCSQGQKCTCVFCNEFRLTFASSCLFKGPDCIRISAQQAPGKIVRKTPNCEEEPLPDIDLSVVLVNHQLGNPGYVSLFGYLRMNRNRIAHHCAEGRSPYNE